MHGGGNNQIVDKFNQAFDTLERGKAFADAEVSNGDQQEYGTDNIQDRQVLLSPANEEHINALVFPWNGTGVSVLRADKARWGRHNHHSHRVAQRSRRRIRRPDPWARLR